MSGKTKAHGPSSPTLSSSSVEDGVSSSSHSKLGRKETEHKRRVVENQYYDELTTLLSMISERDVLKKMDKVTTLKEAVICIRVYFDLALKTVPPPNPSDTPSKMDLSSCPTPQGSGISPDLFSKGEMLSFFLDAHDSFLIIISETGRILYATELVTSLLGQMQSRLVGQNIYTYVHSRHTAVIQSLFAMSGEAEGKKVGDVPLLVFPSRQFTAHFKLYTGETSYDQQYLPFSCLSFLRKWEEPPATPRAGRRRSPCVVIIGKLPTSMTPLDLAVSTNDVNFEFEMRISRKGHIIDVAKHAELVCGFSAAEMIGTLFFEYVDPYHIADVGDSIAKFLSEGVGMTTPYRIRTKGGRRIWMISKGYLSYDPWNNKLNHVLLANRVLGCDQVLPEHRFYQDSKHMPDQNGRECYVPDLDTPTPISSVSPPPVPRTSRVFTPRANASTHPAPLRAQTRGDRFLTPQSNAVAYQVGGGGNAPQQKRNTPQQRGNAPQRRTRGDAFPAGGGTELKNPASTPGGDQEALKKRLLEYEKSLMEREQQLSQQKMQFMNQAEKMMHQLSQVGGSSQALNPSSIMDMITNMETCVGSPMMSSAPSPAAYSALSPHSSISAPSPRSVMSMEDPSYQWEQRHPLHMAADQLYINSPPTAMPPTAMPPTAMPPAPHKNPSQNFSAPTVPLYPDNLSPQMPMMGAMDGSMGFPSLVDHNAQFYQQQQQQQQLQQQLHQQGRMLPPGMDIGTSGGVSMGPAGGGVSMGPAGGGIPMAGERPANNFDLSDILNSTSASN